jgi:O-antigen/teichoic acid export membrane protein
MLQRVGILLLAQVVSKGLAFVAFAWLARKLGASEYGAVEYAFGLATFAALAVEGGLGSVGVRRLAQGEQPAARLAALIPTAQTCIALVVVPAMIAVRGRVRERRACGHARCHRRGQRPDVAVEAGMAVPGARKHDAARASQILRAAVFALGAVALVNGSSDVNRVGMLEIAAVAAATLYLMFVQARSIAPIRARVSRRELLDLGREAAPIGAAAIVWALIQYAPLLMLANMAGMVDTAYFGAAHRLGVSLVTFSWIYHFNFYPTIAQRLVADPDATARLTLRRSASPRGLGSALRSPSRSRQSRC